MACCGRGPDRPKTPKHIFPPNTVPAVTNKSVAKVVPQTPAPPGSFNPPGRFCSKCGWIVAITKYADPCLLYTSDAADE